MKGKGMPDRSTQVPSHPNNDQDISLTGCLSVQVVCGACGPALHGPEAGESSSDTIMQQMAVRSARLGLGAQR